MSMKAIGIILAGGNNEGRLGVLTDHRAAAALPVGSSYRAIDFTLSNMSNSGIGKVAVLTQYNSRSLRDHLTSSKWWDFGRKHGGLFVFTPFTSSTDSNWFRGTADSIYQNMTYLLRSNEEYVVITSGDSIYKMDYHKLVERHEEKGADITIAYQRMYRDDLNNFGIMEMDEGGRLLEFEEKPEHPKTNEASLGIYVISRTLLIDILNEIIPQGGFDFVKDILIAKRKELKIYGYEFKGYWNTLSTGVSAYYNVNMDFLKKEVRDAFINEYPYIETKAKDEPPAKYNKDADVRDSLVGSGTIFNGKVEHSIIFRKVYTGEGSVVKNSILMEGCRIGKDCVVENAILDKEVVLSDGQQIIGKSIHDLAILKKGTRL
ncbi:glucose-1-phosphate adenylyltransferase subunit GlgD [Anaerotignum sp. MB30-C6]|uniref:glucose-1-phosphate adenylyltransferase subunit GlgD n=1 Tax=Anaerotignum sp. MB30-C6 TaxID=3070814 RepID=UPI0027DB6533|nr:glucose-1-phosphate adenylyltransferase subunit GlgD [Anaerotignum sp. MB30-C6]WMI81477.1 glucose-1-phosphate adenylyltransferase subunit GlgD [Anaerotignum sp. MB30-C6]